MSVIPFHVRHCLPGMPRFACVALAVWAVPSAGDAGSTFVVVQGGASTTAVRKP